VHTRLDLHFDYLHCYLNGREWVTVTPHFYPTDSLRLDARGMDIRQVALMQNGQPTPLKFTYDGFSLAIRLNRTWRRHESYTVFIDYTAKPNELKFADNTLARFNRGLYFVNPDSTEKGKPVQIYTQGETENASVWFPTIDKPDQKTTDEIRMTVPAKYVTLSNGRLAKSKDNGDGTRTDVWQMDLPQPPYLFRSENRRDPHDGAGKICHAIQWTPGEEQRQWRRHPYRRLANGSSPAAVSFHAGGRRFPDLS